MSYAARQEALVVKSVATGSPVTPLVEPISVTVPKLATVSAVKSLISQGEVTPKVVPVLPPSYKVAAASQFSVNPAGVSADVDPALLKKYIDFLNKDPLSGFQDIWANAVSPQAKSLIALAGMGLLGEMIRDAAHVRESSRMAVNELSGVAKQLQTQVFALPSSSSFSSQSAVSSAPSGASGNWLYSNVPRLGYIRSKKGNYYIKKVR